MNTGLSTKSAMVGLLALISNGIQTWKGGFTFFLASLIFSVVWFGWQDPALLSFDLMARVIINTGFVYSYFFLLAIFLEGKVEEWISGATLKYLRFVIWVGPFATLHSSVKIYSSMTETQALAVSLSLYFPIAIVGLHRLLLGGKTANLD